MAITGNLDELTSVWVKANPGASVAAGVAIDPAAVVAPGRGREEAIRELSQTRSWGGTLEDQVASSVAVLARHADRGSDLREWLECLRGLVYVGGGHRTNQDWDGALSRALSSWSHRDTTDAVGRVLARGTVDAISALGRSAGMERTSAAAAAVSASLPDVPSEATWDWVASLAPGVVRPSIGGGSYEEVLRLGYGFHVPLAALRSRAQNELELESGRMRDVGRRVGARLPGTPSHPEHVATAIEAARAPTGSALDRARQMAGAARSAFLESLIEGDPTDDEVLPEATPDAMQVLVTEGEEYLGGALTDRPRVWCFITPGKCGSAYTLANVLYHELAHCWHMMRSAKRSRDLPGPLRAGSALGNALTEGIATYREWEVYEVYAEAPEGDAYRSIFDSVCPDRRVATEEFEFDTRYWRVARLVRALFDFDVHGAGQPYADFVRGASSATGLSADRIHRFCFSFFEKPGYAPCYAFGALWLAELQAELGRSGMSRREFNSRVSSMGMVPPSTWRERIMLMGEHKANARTSP